MIGTKYPIEILSQDDDDGTIVANVLEFENQVIGRRIVNVQKTDYVDPKGWNSATDALEITLDNGKKVYLVDTNDCCAHTELQAFLWNADKVDHVITGVGTTDGYDTWHIYADMGDVLALTVGWGCGNPFYYGYGFDIAVTTLPEGYLPTNVKTIQEGN